MKYICLGYMDGEKLESMTESEMNAFVDECFAYDEKLTRAGHIVGGEALQGVHTATTLRWGNGKVVITDGPFAETKEHLGGIMVLQATDLNHAIRLLSKHPSISMGGTWEIRPSADISAMRTESEKRRAATNK